MVIAAIVFILVSNLAVILQVSGIGGSWMIWMTAATLFILCNIFPSFRQFPVTRLKNLQRGVALLIEFLITCVVDVAVLVVSLVFRDSEFCTLSTATIVANSVIAFLAGVVIFWNGIIRVYVTSAQLGVKWRVIGILCGMIPIAHLIVLGIIIKISYREYTEETARFVLNVSRADDQVCKTRYPILMVHGVFFRDIKYFKYWGRIPKDLEKNGATLFYGQQESARSVEECGRQLAERIRQIVEGTGCGKVNIIAHSKGGLDSRAAITLHKMAPYVASLTTVNTPHRGCLFADYLLGKAPEKLKRSVAASYNAAMIRTGEKDSDFLSAVYSLTNEECEKFNEACPDVPGVYYQSIGSKSVNAVGGRFPLNLSYIFVKKFDGPNDGLVALSSMQWGENFIVVEPRKKRGITHGDIIDLNRENIDGFDVRETYVQIVKGLKDRGL